MEVEEHPGLHQERLTKQPAHPHLNSTDGPDPLQRGRASMEKGFPYPSEPTILVSPLPKWKNKSLKDDDSLEEDRRSDGTGHHLKASSKYDATV